jgi:AhpD family alkylhydroperoxidase
MMAQLAERPTERGAEPIELMAHAPELLRGVLAHQQAAAEANRIPTRLKHLAGLKAATLTNCEYCIDLASQISRRAGLDRSGPSGWPGRSYPPGPVLIQFSRRPDLES